MHHTNAIVHRYQPVLELMPALSPEQRSLALAIYRGIADEDNISVSHLAAETGWDAAAIDAFLDESPGVFRDNEGNVIGFWGLSASPVSEHRVYYRGRTLYAWCAWDTLFLPALLGDTCTVESRCAHTGEAISLTVSPESIERTSHPDIHVSMLVPDEGAFTADVVSSFCHHVHFLADENAARAWVSNHPGIETITLADAFGLGAVKNRQQFLL